MTVIRVVRAAGLALVIVSLATAAAGGQAQWTQATPSMRPAALWTDCMAYDPVRRVGVLVGGFAYNQPAETWEWDGVDWTHRSPKTRPLGGAYTIAYDKARRRTVLIGGASAIDVWEWDGFDWTRRIAKTTPPYRTGFASAYDPLHRRVVLFGGAKLGETLNDTWEWDGTDWSRAAPTSSPPSRRAHAMAYHPGLGRVVLFAGLSGSPLSDTWVWQGTTWLHKSSALRPPARYEHPMCYDGARGRVVLFGGRSATRGFNDTWEWDGVSWTQRVFTPPPPWKSGAAMIYHEASRRTVLFGGVTGAWPLRNPVRDTWEYGATHLTGSGTPRPGQVVGLALSSPADAGLRYQLASAFDDGPVPVGPLSLGLQMDALFWISLQDTWPTVFRGFRGRLDPAGRATASIVIPKITALVGQKIHSAFMVIDPAAPSPFRSVSNTLVLPIQP